MVGVGKVGEGNRLDGSSGINLPLAFTGQEAIWQKVFQVLLSSIWLIFARKCTNQSNTSVV